MITKKTGVLKNIHISFEGKIGEIVDNSEVIGELLSCPDIRNNFIFLKPSVELIVCKKTSFCLIKPNQLHNKVGIWIFGNIDGFDISEVVAWITRVNIYHWESIMLLF